MPPKKAAVSSGSQSALSRVGTWVRIRPIGEHGHTKGDAVEKELGDFDENAINIVSHDQGNKVTSYDYMSKVFPVDCAQADVADAILPRLLDDFWSDGNVMIFAYGQTGTGKTHTMFGVQDSLTATTDNPGWGLLPRVVHATLNKIQERAGHGIHTILLLSAVEFYCGQCYDLADKAGKQMCSMKGSQVIGNSYQHCDSPAVLAEFIERVYGNRCVVATKMNDGSSRSHCAITLTLMTSDESQHSFKQTELSIVDLAGSERPEKASHTGKRITKEQAILELYMYFAQLKKGAQAAMSPELQGYLINGELTGMLTEVANATECAKHNRAYKSGNYLGGSALAFLGGALAGEARLDALICLSQSPQNGWETWFSIAQFGKELSKLKTRIKKVPVSPIDKALKGAQGAASEAAEAWANQRDTPSAMKYAAFRFGMKVYTEQRLQYIQMLSKKQADAAGSGATVENVQA